MSLLDELLAEAIQARIDRAVAAERARAEQHEALMIQRERQSRREESRPLEVRLDGRVLAGAIVDGDMKRRRRS